MSSLWTPGGEVPVDRGRRAPEPPPADPQAGAAPPDEAAMAAELQRFLRDTPAEQVVLQHAVGLYELAAVHLSQAEPRLPDARLAIDALRALVEGLTGRLGPDGEQLAAVLPQLQIAYVQAADRVAGSGSDA